MIEPIYYIKAINCIGNKINSLWSDFGVDDIYILYFLCYSAIVLCDDAHYS